MRGFRLDVQLGNVCVESVEQQLYHRCCMFLSLLQLCRCTSVSLPRTRPHVNTRVHLPPQTIDIVCFHVVSAPCCLDTNHKLINVLP